MASDFEFDHFDYFGHREFDPGKKETVRGEALSERSSQPEEARANVKAASELGVAIRATDRRVFLRGAVASAAALAWPNWARAAAGDIEAIRTEIAKRHNEAVQRLQQWVRQPSIAAENKGMTEGCELMMRMLREAGFSRVT
ncbi:MAG TPA: hypothetical protein VGK99_03190, partial [Acidobacteriota bacterium]